MRLIRCLALCAFATSTCFAQSNDLATINRIIDEGFNHSELPQTAAYLTDRIGGRMTNSPQMRAAEKWTQEQYRDWGLKNVHTEGFDFGRGWSIESFERAHDRRRARCSCARSPSPGRRPPTARSAPPIVVAPMKRERDFAKWQGKLRGKIVLVDKPQRWLGARQARRSSATPTRTSTSWTSTRSPRIPRRKSKRR